MSENDKSLVWIQGQVKTPPFSADARIKAGFLLRRLQKGDMVEMPDSRPMPTIGKNCHENFESMTRIKRGASSISSMMMPLSYWRSSPRKHKRHRRKSLM